MSSFTITTPEASVTLRPSSVKPGETAKGTVTYGVTNKTGATIRTGLRIKPSEGAQQAWFTVRGGDERDIAPGATESFSVDLSVPGVPAPGEGGSPGSGDGGSGTSEAVSPAGYRFAAVAVNLRDPDNDFETGSPIAFRAPALEPKPDPKIKWWMIAAPIALLLVVGGALWALWPDERVTLPNFEGSLLAEARSTLTSQGYSVEEIALSVGGPEFDRQQFYDQIVTEQTPESDGTTPIERPDKVQLGWEWKPKKVTVPDVVDLAFGPAVSEIEKAGLRYVGAIGPAGNPPSNLHYPAVASVSPTGQQDAGTGITFTMKWKQGLRLGDVVILQQQFEVGKNKVTPMLQLRRPQQ
ncbi:MAG TPA: hypothetical protein VF329_00140 [Gammaproteobacteria bacterium]